VPGDSHSVENVFGFVVFYGGFPVPKCVEVYSKKAWIRQLVRCSLSISVIAASHASQVSIVSENEPDYLASPLFL
jgi:hypothetical protein